MSAAAEPAPAPSADTGPTTPPDVERPPAPSRAAEPAPAAAALPDSIILYDGVCGLCAKAVRFLIQRDRGRVHYAPLQGETAERLRALHPRIPTRVETVVLVDRGKVYLRSKAFLHVARHLTRPWRWAYAFRWLPAFLLDPFYWLVAKVRYRLFGKYDTCRLPTSSERARLLP
ncbi:MAG TPA: DCC1-like thiol-disulfide oxidoreductase family protein [Kofleriaceae bacterium]|nr:DCC1-like thiol-disulfide oxidoreductase family protein [Kofleriaceae bacterium]